MEADVLRTMTRPVIIFWAFQHFLVVEGIRSRYGKTVVAINDPASGPRLMDWDEFDSGFTGIVLTFEPGPDFRTGGRPTRTGAALLQRRLSSGRALPLVLLASVLLVGPGLAAPAFSRVFIDRVLTGGSGSYLVAAARRDVVHGGGDLRPHRRCSGITCCAWRSGSGWSVRPGSSATCCGCPSTSSCSAGRPR